jgi:urease accessory protein UreH
MIVMTHDVDEPSQSVLIHAASSHLLGRQLSNNSATVQKWRNELAQASRSALITIQNNTSYLLKRTAYSTSHGDWAHLPPGNYY